MKNQCSNCIDNGDNNSNNNCNHRINDGVKLRYILTIIVLIILSYYQRSKFISKYLLLIIPIVLTLLDFSDFSDNIITTIKNNYLKCTNTFHYQIVDKICDSISYLLLFVFFDLNYLLLFFILYRIIGVFLFWFTKNSWWFVIFFDFAKEFLLYLFIFGTNYSYLFICIIFKITFEYIFHTKVFSGKY